MRKANDKSRELLRLETVISAKLGHQKAYNDWTANGLTNCILDFIQIVKEQQAERFHSGGIPYIHPETKEQCYAKPIVTTGTADIHCTINRISVKIEVKIGTDKQSEKQKQYQQKIEKAGGVYYIARNFADFSWWYHKTFEQ